MSWHTYLGTLQYTFLQSEGPKLIVKVELDLGEYYRSLVPPSYRIQCPRFLPHVSVVRNERPNLARWGVYQGLSIELEYSNIVGFDQIYCWLPIRCQKLSELREELDLPGTSAITKSHDGVEDFHLTLGHTKF